MPDPSQSFDGRRVLLAGASGGVGLAAARTLLSRGARVALHYRRDGQQLEEIASAHGAGSVALIQADLGDRASVDRLVEDAAAALGGIDGCLSTVGSALRMQPFLDIDDRQVELTITTELRSAIWLARAVLPHLRVQESGRLVYVGSDSGKVGTSGEVISAACRGGLISFAKSLAREFARDGVLVNVVCPGPTATSLWDDLVANDEFGGKIGTAMARAIPLRRIGEPEEVASAAVYLLSTEASFITGQALSVSGGLTMS